MPPEDPDRRIGACAFLHLVDESGGGEHEHGDEDGSLHVDVQYVVGVASKVPLRAGDAGVVVQLAADLLHVRVESHYCEKVELGRDAVVCHAQRQFPAGQQGAALGGGLDQGQMNPEPTIRADSSA